MNDRNTLWQSIVDEQSISISLLHKNFTLSIYPILLLVVHTAVFLATRPYIDLPVYDDAFYFAKATLLTRGIFTLHGDWSPLLVYFASIFRFVISGNPILAFALYTYFCQLVFLFGSYSLILVFTRKKDWAFLSTLLIAVVISYPLNINGHLFPAGAVMSIAAWLEKKKNVDIYLAAALVLISVSLRFEYILILGGLIVRSFYRYYAAGKWTSIFKPNVLSIVALTSAIAIWIPIFLWGSATSGRFGLAFQQKFASYARAEGLCEQKELSPNAQWEEITEAFFPVEKRQPSTFNRFFPIYSTVSANPQAFYAFITRNAAPFLRCDFAFSESNTLSSFVSVYCHISFLLLVAYIVIYRRWDLSSYLFVSFIFALSIVACLVTVPYRYYLLPSIVWFAGALPIVWVTEFRRWKTLIVSIILIGIFHQYPDWKTEFARMSRLPNYARARALEEASKNESFRDCTIAEAYPSFSIAFGKHVKSSVDYNVYWDREGILRSSNGTQPPVDFVLLEQPPADHPFSDIEFLQRILQSNGEMIAEYHGYSVWKVRPIQIFITDDADHNDDLCLGSDIDFADNRQLAVRWNIEQHNFIDFHIWVKIDGGEKQYLGRSAGGDKTRFVWNDAEEWVDSPFKNGPQFGHTYEFIVYGIPKDRTKDAPVEHFTKGPVEYLEGK